MQMNEIILKSNYSKVVKTAFYGETRPEDRDDQVRTVIIEM